MPSQVDIEHDYKRLKVLLEDTDDAVIAFILYRNIKEQRENAEKLRNLLDLPIAEVELKGDNLNPVYTFLDLPREPRQAIFYTFLGSSLPEGKSDFDKFAGYVNIQREAFTDAPHAVVLWLREEQLVRLMKRAPDFWAWRSGVFDVRGELQPGLSAYRELEEVDAFERGELEHQVALYREILKGQLEREEPDLAYIARTRLRLVNALHKLGLYEIAIEETKSVIRIANTLKSGALYYEGLSRAAMLHDEMGHYAEAINLYNMTLEAAEKLSGKNSVDYATPLSDFGDLLRTIGRYEEAEQMLREALRIKEDILGTEHSYYVNTLHKLAILLDYIQNYKEAEMLFRQAIDTISRTQGSENPAYASSLSTLASLLASMQRYDEAEEAYDEALRIEAKLVGEDHPNYANKLSNFASLLWDIGRLDEAELAYGRAVEIYNERLGINHPITYSTTQTYNNLREQLEQTPNP